MNNFFETIEEQLNKDPEALMPIYRVKFLDQSLAFTLDEPFAERWVPFLKNRTIFVNFRDKRPGVITRKKYKDMEMISTYLTRDTYKNEASIDMIEKITSKKEMQSIVEMFKALREKGEEKDEEKSDIIV